MFKSIRPHRAAWRGANLRAGASLLVLAVLLPNLAQARQVTDLDGVIVTAAKRETRLLDTPMSITVLDRKTLSQTRADSFADFAALVPGLSYTDSGPGNKRYALRGLQSAGEPEVALYYDETPVSGLPGGSLDTGDSQPDFKLWDIERIEVLRGPQGTLYGNGSMGGAIRVISRRPVLDAVEGAVQTSGSVTAGGDPSFGVSAMANLPLVKDKLAARLTGYVRREGGWIDDKPRADIALPQIDKDNLNWEHTWGGRGSVSLQATPHWNLTAIAYYQDLRTGGSSELYPAYATAGDHYVSKSYVRTPWREKAEIYNLISSHDLGWADLVATGSYQHRSLARSVDTTRFLLGNFGCNELTWNKTCFGPAILPAIGYSNETVSAWSGEVRLTSKMPGPFQWTLGAFLQDSSTNRRSQVAKVDADGLIQLDPTTGDAIGRVFERDNHDTFDQAALFGEGSYDLTEKLTATVGLRWFHSHRTDQQVLVQQFFPGNPTGAQPFQDFKESKVFQKYELAYKLSSQGLIYVQAAQGFRAGGPNFPGGFNLSAQPYQADSVWDYEAGWKLNLAQNRLYWSGAVFRIDWKDLQQLVPTTLFNYIANAGAARSEGFETELAYHPSPGLSLSTGITYQDARLVGAQPAQTNPALQLRSGDKLANVPDWTVHASVGYSHPLANGYTLSGRLDASHQSGRGSMVAARHPAYFQIGGYELLDLHLTLDSDKAWRLGLDIDNLLDAYAPLSAKTLDSNLAKTVAAARPRTVSLTLDLTY